MQVYILQRKTNYVILPAMP